MVAAWNTKHDAVWLVAPEQSSARLVALSRLARSVIGVQRRMCEFVDFSPAADLSVRVLQQRRQELLLEAVERDGAVRVSEMSLVLDVSEMTVRRDLGQLAEAGLVDKVHGGAVKRRHHATDEPGFDVKQNRQMLQKAAIARAACDMVEPASAVALSAGTTTWATAKLLARFDELTVVTNSPTVAQIFHRTPGCRVTVVLTGGVRTPSDALVGPLATAALSNLHVDMVMLGVHGMDERGFSTPNLAEAEVNQAFVRAAGRVVVLADHTKWGTQGLATIAPLDAADLVISDDRLAPEAIEAFADCEATEVRLVSPESRPASAAAI